MGPTHKTSNDVAPYSAATVGNVTQASTATFKGGEYFNDPTKVSSAARGYMSGDADIDTVAKSVGFDNGAPDGTTPLSVEQQQMLGFREYNPTRNWNSYVTSSYMWQHGSGKTSVDSWAGKGSFAGAGSGGFNWGGLLGGLFKVYGAIRLAKEQKKAMAKAHADALAHPKININKDNFAKGATIGGITQAAIGTFKGGEYFNDPSKITAEAKAYVATGAGDLNTVAKSVGFVDGARDASAILTVEQQEMLGFKEFDPKRTWGDYVSRSKIWQDKKSTDAERWAAQNGFKGSGRGDRFAGGGFFDFFTRWFHHKKPVSNGSNAPGSPASKVPSPSDPTHKTANESYSNAAHVGDIVQADISTFKGGEYYNDPSKVTAAAKAFARGQADIDDVAKSVGFANGAPDGTTPLTVEQQQMLGFREYNPTRNWNSYVTASYMWQHSHGQTSVESWMNAHNPGFTGGGVGDYKHSNSGSSSNSVIYTGSGHMAGSGNATEYQRKVSKMSMRGNGTGARLS